MCGRFNEGVEIEPVSDFLAPPTPLFPLPAHSPPIRQAQGMLPRGQASREGEVCSFLLTFCAPPS